MIGKLTNNQVLLGEIVLQEFNENNSYRREDDFFEFYSASQVLKQFDLSYEEIESGLAGASLDGGCDSLYVFVNGVLIEDDFDYDSVKKDIRLEFYIIQSKNKTSFGEDVFDKWKTLSANLLDLAIEEHSFSGRYNDKVLSIFKVFRDSYIKLIRKKIKVEINYVYISKGIDIHPNVTQQSEELKELIKGMYTNNNVVVKINFIGANELMHLINTQSDENFSLKLCENPIQYQNSSDFICLVKLTDFYQFITTENHELIRHIFESNVRDYQGNTSVNTEIQETLKGNSNGDFWWLNNGITIIAKESSPISGKELQIVSPEIVNGLQTSTEIYNYFSTHPETLPEDKRSLLVRIIVPKSDEERDKIILATNSQTSIPKASLRATDSIHRQIEMYFKSRGLYYDRRKNYYKNQGKPSSLIISISYLGQCLMAVLLKKPDHARARPSTILTNDEEYKKLFSEKVSLEAYHNIAVIGKKIEGILKKDITFSSIEIGDIFFYLLYYTIGMKVSNTQIDSKDIASLGNLEFDKEEILDYAREIFEEYSVLGGNSKVAKGSDLVKRVEAILLSNIEKNKLIY